MKRRDLDLLLQDLFEGNLGAAELSELERELNASPEACEAYIDYAHLHNALQLRAEGIDLLHVVPMELANRRLQRKFLHRSIFVAAAAVVMIAVVLGIISAPSPTLKFAASPGTDAVVSHELGGEKKPQGASMEPGSRLEIRRGTVEVTFASGVRGIIRGPADITLRSPGLLHMAKGAAWFQVPHSAVGFQVTTPDLLLTDLGTEFGILSNEDFLHEVHVFRGAVEVTNGNGLRNKKTLLAGQARRAETGGEWRSIALDAAQFLRKLPDTVAPAVETDVVVTSVANTDKFAYVADVAADDLLHGLIPETSGWNLNNNAHPNELTDGIHGVTFNELPFDKVQGAWTTVGATATYHLGSGPGGHGYDLASIRSVAAWNGAGFGNQRWLVEVKPVGGAFKRLSDVDFQPFSAIPLDGGGATKVTLTGKSGKLARGIEAIRFTAGRVPNSVDGAFVWREVDVIGAPSGSVSR